MSLKKFTLKKLAKLTNSTFVGNENAEISGVNSLKDANINEASFLANDRYLEALKNSNAGVICIDEKMKPAFNKNYLISKNPSKTFQILIEIFASEISSGFEDIHETAIVHSSAKIGKNVYIGPYVVVDKNVKIGDNTKIYPHCYIGPNSHIGIDCLIYSNVSIRENVIIQNRVVIQPGAVIGSCGFGFIKDKNGKYQKLKQIGNVLIEDDVEIGANTTIDRARFSKTIIKSHTIIDNLVQIAHNVEIGENSAIAAQSGISGSTKLGKDVILAGQVGIAGHLNLDDNVIVTAKSGVSKNLKTGMYRGTPAIEFNKWNKSYIQNKKVPKLMEKIEQIETLLQKDQKSK